MINLLNVGILKELAANHLSSLAWTIGDSCLIVVSCNQLQLEDSTVTLSLAGNRYDNHLLPSVTSIIIVSKAATSEDFLLLDCLTLFYCSPESDL
jgi:hypothetical protein